MQVGEYFQVSQIQQNSHSNIVTKEYYFIYN